MYRVQWETCINNSSHLLLPFRLIADGELVEQLRVHLHEGLEHVVDQRDDGLVPVLLGYAVEGGEHDRHDDVVVLLHQGHYVLVVPEIQGPLCHLNTIFSNAKCRNRAENHHLKRKDSNLFVVYFSKINC